MEAVSFAVGIVSLASLFDTCVQLADCISLAQNLGRDCESTYTKYLLVRARLYAWKSCLDILERDETKQWSEERILVCRSLAAIKSLLQDSQGLENRYGLRNDSVDYQNESWKHGKISESILEIEKALNTSMKQRQQIVSWRKKLRWAIRDKKAFDDLISNFSFHVNELEKLAKRMQAPASRSIQESIQNITSPAAVQLLQDAVIEPDLKQSSLCTDGHIFVRNQVEEHANVLFGNVGLSKNVGQRHIYAGNQVIGNAKVIMGNLSGESMAVFFGL